MKLDGCLRLELGGSELTLKSSRIFDSKPAAARRSELSLFLKDARRRAPREPHHDVVTHGKTRLGKPLSQEEISRAAGISREWYARLEGGHPVNISARLIERISTVLSLDDGEREFFRNLAMGSQPVPTFPGPAESADLLFGVRAFLACLWTASSEIEVLTLTCEYARRWLGDSILILAEHREGCGNWKRVGYQGSDPKIEASELFRKTLEQSLSAREVDSLVFYPAAEATGALATPDLYDPVILELWGSMRRDYGLLGEKIHGRIVSRGGRIGGITVLKEPGLCYSDGEILALRTLCHFASLALS